MVIAHSSKVGQFAKKRSDDELKRGFLKFFLGGMMLVYLSGMAAGIVTIGNFEFATGRRSVWVAIATIAATFVAFVAWRSLSPVIDRFLNSISRRRIALLRGGQAETYTSLLIRDYFDDDYELWDNLKLDATSDIDHVLIGPTGLFVISTKSQKGRFILGEEPTMNGRPVDWCHDVTRQAMRLRDKLTVVERELSPPWIQTILCVPFAHIEPRDAKTHHATFGPVWVVNEDDLLNAIQDRPDTKQRLSPATRTRWTAAVGHLAGEAPNPS